MVTRSRNVARKNMVIDVDLIRGSTTLAESVSYSITDVVMIEHRPLDPSLAVDLGAIFKLPPNLTKIDIQRWANVFDLP